MTEIDSLQISIESNSKGAAQGISELAGSLEQLKKHGSVSVAVKNLKSLSEELRNFPDNSQAGRALGRVAGALRQLKEVGSVKKAADSLATMSNALKSLEKVSVDTSKFAGIASALGVLSNVKAGGINTMMNGLLKLGKVTESLNDDAINAFAERIEKLTEKLTPLSAKMTTIQSGLKGINSNAKSTGQGVKQMGEEVDGAAVNLSSFIYTIQEAIGWLQQAIQKFSEFMSQAIEWDGISARFGRTFGEQAEETYGWIQRLNEEMEINVQQFMQYSSLYSQMLTGFGVATEDARTMAVGYTELTYDIWAAANDRYKTFEDAADAVASAIAGEVEPIRRAGFTIVESTLAETAAYHGLDISLANATEAQKSYLRYLTLVDQAHATGTIGVYAKELNTAEGMMRTFSQQLKSLTQAFGSLFLPVLVKVMPYLQAFVELLADGVRWIAGLFGVEIQEVDFSGYKDGAEAVGGVADSANDATGALGKAAKAAKELKNATLGIDELNVISPPSPTGGSGGSGSGGAGAGGGFDGLDIGSLWDETIFDNIQSDVDSIKEKLKGWMPIIAGIAAGFAGLRLAKLIIDIDDVVKKLKGIFTFSAAGAAGGGGIAAAIKWIKEYIAAAKQMAPEVGWMAALFPKLSSWLAGIPAALAKVAPVLAKAGPYAGIAAAVVGGITLALVDYDFTDVGYKIGEKIGSGIRNAVGWIKEKVTDAFKWVKNAFDIDDIWDVFAILFVPGEWIKRIGPEITEIFNGVSDWINDKIKNLKGNINEFFDGFFDGLFDGLGVDVSWAEQFADVFDIKYLDIVEAVMNPRSIGKHIMTGINKGIDGNAKLSAIKDKLSAMWTNAKSWWDNKKSKLKEYTPSIGSIYEKLKPRWDNARDWWNNKKTKMKEYTPSIGSIYEKVSTRWKNARDWYNNKKAAMKSYTPSIGSIKDKLKSAWNTAKSWWNKNVKLSIPSLKFKVTYSEPSSKTMRAIMKALDLPGWPKLSFAANGGMFDMGSLVWAGERGPEIVAGASGGKTGVMNVQQMSDAMYEAVYSAVIAANRASGGNGGQEVNVYLDGRKVTASVEQHQRERGASVMGTQVYSYG